MKPIRIEGHVDVPKSLVVTLNTKDRFDLVVGRPIIMNNLRYVLTQREPAAFKTEGAPVYIVLGRDNRDRRPKSDSLKRLLGHGKQKGL